MATLYTHKDANVRKTWVLMTTFLLLVIGLGWAVSWYVDSPAILIIAVVFAVGMNIISYWTADKVVLARTGAKEVTRESHPELWNVTENLAITAGLPMPALYIIRDDVPNAFATGRDPEHASVAVTTGLLARLDRSELEGVIAHELSHVGNRDILISTIVVVLVGFITLLSDMFLRAQFFGGRREGRAGAIALLIGLAFAILSPLVATVIQLAISRKREFLADADGALLTRYPEGLASALEKIAAHSGEMKRADHATAHLYIASPFGSKERKGFLNKLFATHPPVEERINSLRNR